jgi:hypothetical protein
MLYFETDLHAFKPYLGASIDDVTHQATDLFTQKYAQDCVECYRNLCCVWSDLPDRDRAS